MYPTASSVFALLVTVLSVCSAAVGQEINIERAGLIYGIGSVEQVNSGSATIDMACRA